MASLRFYAFLALLVLSFSVSETRPLTPYIEGRNLIASIQAVAAMEALMNTKANENGNTNNSYYDSKRQSPGGPDPQHH